MLFVVNENENENVMNGNVEMEMKNGRCYVCLVCLWNHVGLFVS